MTLHAYRRSAVVVFVLVAALMSAAAGAQQKVGSDFLVTNVRVFDGQQTLPNTHVAVTGGVIRAVGGDVAAWRSLPIIDGTDSTLVPGLIDAHSHVRDADDLRQALCFGVTTALDMGLFALTPGDLSAIRTRANAATDMADVRSAGYPATSPRGHGTQFGTVIPRFSAMITASDFVAMRQAEGSDYLKIMLNGVRSPSPRLPTSHGISTHRELELLGKAGLRPSEILAAATANAADAFRLADRGRILPGLRADMLLVRGDPTADILAVRDIVRVWKLGVEVDRAVAER